MRAFTPTACQQSWSGRQPFPVPPTVAGGRSRDENEGKPKERARPDLRVSPKVRASACSPGPRRVSRSTDRIAANNAPGHCQPWRPTLNMQPPMGRMDRKGGLTVGGHLRFAIPCCTRGVRGQLQCRSGGRRILCSGDGRPSGRGHLGAVWPTGQPARPGKPTHLSIADRQPRASPPCACSSSSTGGWLISMPPTAVLARPESRSDRSSSSQPPGRHPRHRRPTGRRHSRLGGDGGGSRPPRTPVGAR
jgi:hypothetical protein